MPNDNSLLPTTITLPTRPRSQLRSPLPDPVRSPVILLLVILVPQMILLLLNVRDFHLMSGEMNSAQTWCATGLFVFELALLAGGGLFARRLCANRQPVSWVANWPLLIAHVGYLTAVTMAIAEQPGIVPASVAQWIVQPDALLFHQFVFIMPAVFYSALSLACFSTRRGRLADIGFSFLAAGVPAFWYLFAQISRGVSLPAAFWIIVGIASSLVCLAGFLRLITTLYVWAQSSSRAGQTILVALVGLAGPLGGLALNSRIAFPADFQSPFIYALAALNGVLLLLPSFHRLWLGRALWLARCAMLPFTLYFFLVYLPFLPLALPAMLVAGAGFLILVPTALLIVHVRSILAPFAAELRDGWGRRAIGFTALAMTLIPGMIAGEALLERAALGSAMEHVFTPDYRRNGKFHGSLWAVRRSLEQARDQKLAVYQPFLTEFHDWAVFGGLTLSTSKMQTLHQAFFGSRLEEKDAPHSSEFSFNHRRRMTLEPALNAMPFPRDVNLAGLTTTTRAEDDGCSATTAVLELQNERSGRCEYVTTIDVPPGVLVSGYWLHIGNERVPGQIFEKKTALWVYRMVRDVTRRDPGALVYTSPRTLELRVFPFEAGERRVTEIEFLAPPGFVGTVKIGDRAVQIGGAQSSLALTRAGDETQLIMPGAVAQQLPRMTRQPYLHFIVDRSAESTLSPTQAVAAMRRAASSFPAAIQCMVSAANYEFSDLTPELLDITAVERIANLPERKWLPARGALLQDRAIKHALLTYQDRFSYSHANDPWVSRFPIIVVLKGTSNEPLFDGNLGYFTDAVPDVDCYYTFSEDNRLVATGFSDAQPKFDAEVALPQPICVFKHGGSLAVCAASPGEGAALRFRDRTNANLEVFDGEQKAFAPVTNTIRNVSEKSRYALGAAARVEDLTLIENPSLARMQLPEVIRQSRASGVMVPSSAYIVVENSAQRRLLKLKEAQKLQGNQALDFMETPEPSIWLIALAALLLPIVCRGLFEPAKQFRTKQTVYAKRCFKNALRSS